MSWIDENATYYFYGMRLREFGPGCQPMNGLKSEFISFEMLELFEAHKDSLKRHYYDILTYDRQLTDTQIAEYELDYLFSARLVPYEKKKDGNGINTNRNGG